MITGSSHTATIAFWILVFLVMSVIQALSFSETVRLLRNVDMIKRRALAGENE